MTASQSVPRRPYFEGLRGWGALIVLFYHTTQMWGEKAPIHSFSYWENTHSLIWFFIDGRLAVYVFFTISGFVLSTMFFEGGKRSEVLSLAIRRYLRLTIPVLFFCVLVFVAGNSFSQFIAERANAHAVPMTYSLQGSPAFLDAVTYAISDIYMRSSEALTLTPHLWTMPIEMFGSFIVFGILLICGRNGALPVVGLLAFVGTGFFGGFAMGPGLSSMAMGMGLAYMASRPWYVAFEKRNIARVLGVVALLVSLSNAALRDPFRDNILPFCGVLIVFAVMTLPSFQFALGGSVSKWLGRISFPLYLTHVLVLFTVVGLLAPWHQEYPVIVWTATIVSALIFSFICLPVEMFATSFSRRFYQWTLSLTRSSLSILKAGRIYFRELK